jgi:hypothetical protein
LHQEKAWCFEHPQELQHRNRTEQKPGFGSQIGIISCKSELVTYECTTYRHHTIRGLAAEPGFGKLRHVDASVTMSRPKNKPRIQLQLKLKLRLGLKES